MMDSRPLKASRKLQYYRLAGTLLSMGLLVYLIANHWREIIAAFRQISFGNLALVFALMLVSRLAVGSRWFMLLRATNLHVSWGQTVKLTFAGLFASNFLPTTIGGDVVRLAGAVQNHLDGAVITTSLIVDRLVGMFGMALALPLGIIQLLDWFRAESALTVLIPGGWLREGLQKTAHTLRRIWTSLSFWGRQPRSLLEATFFTGIHMLCLFTSIMILLADMGSHLSLGVIGGLWSVVYFVSLLPISINGYGVQEIAMVFMFSGMGGIASSDALTVAVLVRTVQMFAGLPGAAFIPSTMAGSDSH